MSNWLGSTRGPSHPWHVPVAPQFRQSICSNAAKYCKGNNTAYASRAACQASLLTKPMGQGDDVNQDTLVCRALHNTLVPIAPEIHCAHISAGGGGKCTEHTYEEMIAEDFSTCPSEEDE